MMDCTEIRAYLPHRYPFLLVDRVIELIPGESIVACKNLSINEPFFNGHFPIRPVMPGVLIVEALAQATGLLGMESNPEGIDENTIYFFVGIDKARFKRPVEPGDQMHLEVEMKRGRRGIWMFSGIARVDGLVAATADIMCTARDYRS